MRSLLKNLIGWGLIILATLFFLTSIYSLTIVNYPVFVTGLILSFLVLFFGSEVRTDKGKIRNRIAGLMNMYFPECPICKSTAGYEVHGMLSTSQYVRCRTCGAQWASRDFIGYKDLKTLELQEPPDDPKIYATFISQSVLKPRKTYSIKLWQSALKVQEMQTPIKEKTIRVGDFLSLHRREILYLTISFVASTLSTLIGYYLFSLKISESYILFISTFFVVLMGLVVHPQTEFKVLAYLIHPVSIFFKMIFS